MGGHPCLVDAPGKVTVSLEDSLNVYGQCGFDINQINRKDQHRYANMTYMGDGFYLTEVDQLFVTLPSMYGMLKDGQEILPPTSDRIEIRRLASGETIIISVRYPLRRMLEENDINRLVKVQIFDSDGKVKASFEMLDSAPIRFGENSLFYKDASDQEIKVPLE